jgi:hypothetical protein
MAVYGNPIRCLSIADAALLLETPPPSSDTFSLLKGVANLFIYMTFSEG